MTHLRRVAGGNGGQASVELALALPIVLLVLLGLLQVGVFMLEQVQVSGAAREGAREATVSPQRGRIQAAAERAAPKLSLSLNIQRGSTRGAPATVVVTARPTRLPMVGAIVSGFNLKAAATMRIEKIN